MILHILVPFDIRQIERIIALRYILVDTIEARNIGYVVEEGIGEYEVEVFVEVTGNLRKVKRKLSSLLISLGLDNALII